MANEKNRAVWLDLLRIFACMCVVMIHSMGWYLTSETFYGTKTWYACIVLNSVIRTGVPLFLMMSGYLLLGSPKSADIGSFYRRRLLRILIPFAVWDIVYYVYDRLAFSQGLSIGEFFAELINNGSSYHLWYVYTLAAIYLVTPFLRMLVERCSRRQLWLLFVIIIFTGTIRPFLNTVLPVYIYLFEPLAEGYIGFFLLGYLLGTKEKSRADLPLALFGFAAGMVYGILLNLKSSSAESVTLSANGGYGINQFLCAAGVFLLCRYIFSDVDLGRKSTAIFGLISASTYEVYLAHPLVLELIRTNPHTKLNLNLSPAADIIFCFAAAFILPCLIYCVISIIKTKLVRHS